MKDIILIGLGGHAKSVVDSIEGQNQYKIIGFLDSPEKYGDRYKDYSVIGSDEDMQKYYSQGVKYAFVTVGFLGKSQIRNKLYLQMKRIGYEFPVIIDLSSVIASDVSINKGTFVGKNAIVNSDSTIGKMCIINSNSTIEHDCLVKDYSHISVNTVLCGNVSVGEGTFIGASATVLQGLKIGNNVIVGAGVIVTKNIDDNEFVPRKYT